MKKYGLRAVLSVMLCVVFAFIFTACGKPSEDGSGVIPEDPPEEYTGYLFQTELPTFKITATSPISSKYDYVPADYEMVSSSGEYDFTVSGEIRLRGNYSLTMAKKPYRIKFDSKNEVVGMPKSKSWYLLNEATDFSLMRNYLGYTYANYLMDYSLRARYVSVELNGDYRGIYLMTDKRGEDKNRVPITLTDDENTGWIVEVDNRAIGGDDPNNDINKPEGSHLPYKYCKDEGIEFGVNAFYCTVPNFGRQAFVISEPSEPTEEQFEAIERYVSVSVMSLGTDVFDRYIDLDAMARYYMVKELWHDTDVGSVYFYRENGETGSKLKMGPVWDLDLTCGISKILPQGKTNTYKDWYYFDQNAMIKPVYNHEKFREALKKNWNEAYEHETADLIKGIDEVIEFLEPLQAKNFEKWNTIGQGVYVSSSSGDKLDRPSFMADDYLARTTWREHADAVKEFLTKRIEWMNEQINDF